MTTKDFTWNMTINRARECKRISCSLPKVEFGIRLHCPVFLVKFIFTYQTEML